MSREYISAANAINLVLEKKSTLKRCFKTLKMGKQDYAMAYKTLLYCSVIDEVVDIAQTDFAEMDVNNVGMLYVMLYDVLFGRGSINGGGAIKRVIYAHKQALMDALQKAMDRKGVSLPVELLGDSAKLHYNMAKHVRANLLKVTISEASTELRRYFDLKEGLDINDSSNKNNLIASDLLIPSLFVMPQLEEGAPKITNHDWVKEGKLIIQDKASCFPSQILVDRWSSGDIIDACAAPGNKTSLMAGLIHDNMQKKGRSKCKIYAFDKSEERANLLSNRMAEAGADSLVTVKNADFLAVDVKDALYKNVKAVLLDPSCSGSGVIRCLERVVFDSFDSSKSNSNSNSGGGGGSSSFDDADSSNSSNISKDRLMQLRTFQVTALKKAMSFENVELIVYSTCSIHLEENESVVNELLYNSEEGAEWSVEPPQRFTSWSRRGLPFDQLTQADSSALIRCSPADGMNGFFVALFVKKGRKKYAGGTGISSSSSISGGSSNNSDSRSGSSSGGSTNSNYSSSNSSSSNDSINNSKKKSKNDSKSSSSIGNIRNTPIATATGTMLSAQVKAPDGGNNNYRGNKRNRSEEKELVEERGKKMRNDHKKINKLRK